MVADFRLKILATRKKFETRRKKYNVQNLQTLSVRDEFKLELKIHSRYYLSKMRLQS
jgi:hypothetical protein